MARGSSMNRLAHMPFVDVPKKRGAPEAPPSSVISTSGVYGLAMKIDVEALDFHFTRDA